MLNGQLSSSQTQDPAFSHKIWQEVFGWLQNLSQDNPDGEQAIHDRDIYANFMTAETQPREKLLVEAHKKYIDVHYCISGGERIEWAPEDTLAIQKNYDQEKDVALFFPAEKAESVLMTAGKFAVFFPGEGHMPKIEDGINKTIKKVIVKIKADLII